MNLTLASVIRWSAIAYDRRLVITAGSGEQDPRLGARRTNNDPVRAENAIHCCELD